MHKKKYISELLYFKKIKKNNFSLSLRAIKKLIRNIILLNKINSSLWIYLNYFKSFLKSYYVSKKNFDNVVKFKKFISNKSFSTDWTSTNIPF